MFNSSNKQLKRAATMFANSKPPGEDENLTKKDASDPMITQQI